MSLPKTNDFNDDCKTYDFSHFGRENYEQVFNRYLKVWEDCYRKDLLLIGHGKGLGSLLAELQEGARLKRGEYRFLYYPK